MSVANSVASTPCSNLRAQDGQQRPARSDKHRGATSPSQVHSDEYATIRVQCIGAHLGADAGGQHEHGHQRDAVQRVDDDTVVTLSRHHPHKCIPTSMPLSGFSALVRTCRRGRTACRTARSRDWRLHRQDAVSGICWHSSDCLLSRTHLLHMRSVRHGAPWRGERLLFTGRRCRSSPVARRLPGATAPHLAARPTCDQDELRGARGGAREAGPAQHPPQRHRLQVPVVHPHACAGRTPAGVSCWRAASHCATRCCPGSLFSLQVSAVTFTGLSVPHLCVSVTTGRNR
jgi:hypothetical protein